MTDARRILSTGEIVEQRAQEVADDLIGTCRSLHEMATQEEVDDEKFMSVLNTLCFECDCCGWWASTDELHDDAGQEFYEMCDECAAEPEHE